MKKIIFILMGLLLLQSTSCEDSIFDTTDTRLKIDNKSNKDIYYYGQFNYPDTTIVKYDPSRSPAYYAINKQSVGVFRLDRATWEQKFECCIPSDTLQIFIYDEHVLQNIPWEEVRENHLVLKHYELSYEDLLDKNWVIEFSE